MFRKITMWRVIPVLVLLFAVLCTTCSLGDPDGGLPRVSDTVNAKIPFIIRQPQVALSLQTTEAPDAPLTVVAEKEESDGILSYQWLTYTEFDQYVNDEGTPPEAGTGETTDEFTPPNNEDGIFYYYVRVTNYLERANGNKYASVKSDPVIVTVTDPNNAEYPNITALTGGGYYLSTPAPTVTLTVTATVTSGNLSYKWFSSTEPATADGEEISSETGAAYTLTTVTAGTYYYYVEVTNTDNTATGSRKEGTVASLFTVNIVAPNITLTVNTSDRRQYVRGFGGMYAAWDACPQESVADFERMHSPDGLGLNILRIMIMPNNTDIDTTMDDMIAGRDGDNKDQSMYYDIVKTVNKYGGYVLASPWTPPAEWKTNDSRVGGGTLRTIRYQHFADYLKRFCEIMNENGAPIYAFSMQNEPTFKASYDGCEYSTIEHRDWWRQVGASFMTNPVPGWGGGKATDRVLHMTGEAHNSIDPFHTHATQSALQDTGPTPANYAEQYLDIIGRHLYGAGINRFSNEGLKHGKEVWMTEINKNSGEGSYQQDSTWNLVWQFMNYVDLTIRLNEDNAFVWWYSKRFYSFVGDGQYGTTDGDIMYRGYGLSHYAKFAKEMTRVGITLTGTTAAGGPVSTINGSGWNMDGTDPKITAYESEEGDIITLVMYTPTTPTGGGGVNVGTIKVQLPSGFVIGRATAMRSNASARNVAENVSICNDRNSAIVTLPPSEILSVRFVKAE